MGARLLCLVLLASAWLASDEKYDGPVPPKSDLPYLLNASTLKETEAAHARAAGRKDETAFIIPGASSSARTPLAEPIFIMDARQIAPEKLELYQLDVKDGNREVSESTAERKGASRLLYLRVTPLGGHLFKIEPSESLDNGEYALTPNGENLMFCFEIF